MTTAIVKTNEDRAMEFVPFGAVDKIKLNLTIVQNIIAVKTKTGKTCDNRDAMRFMMLCQAQRLNPFAGDAFLVGYDGKDGLPKFSLITSHVAFLKRAESCPDYEGMESGIILLGENGEITEREGDFNIKSEDVVGGWARVHRKGRKPTYRRLSIAQRIPPYDTPFWQGVKAAEQIVKCAEADALRATFPSLLGGLRGESEVVNIAATVTPMIMEGQPPATQQQIADAEKQKTTDGRTPQAELEAIVVEAGFTFTDLQKWGEESGNIPDATSLGSFGEISTSTAKRILVGNKNGGLISGLKRIKGTE